MGPKELRAAGIQNVYPVVRSGEGSEVQEWGLTKREHFAAMAMQGMLSDECGGVGQTWTADACANRACLFADALLRALAAGGEG